MKKITITNFILLTSVSFFTACTSTNTPKPNKLTTLELIGVDRGTYIATNSANETPTVETNELPLARTYPLSVTTNSYNPNDINSLPLARTYPIENEYIQPIVQQPVFQQQRRAVSHYVVNNTNVLNEVEQSAKQLLGKRYVWGATGPYTYDCSGFTQKIYRDAGINIPRISREQARVGEFISYDNLQKGDMVFFDTKRRRSGRVTHVGIYLGNGNFIHASSAAKKIVIYNFNEKSFYKKRFLWGRRVIRDNYYMASL